MSTALLTLLLAVAPQSPADWPNVVALAPGTAIGLAMKGGDVQGTFVAANDDQLVIHLKRGNYSVDKTNIQRLDIKSPESNRGRSADLGAVLGLIGGGLRSKFGCNCNGFGASWLMAESMAIGALVGTTASADKWEAIYRTKK